MADKPEPSMKLVSMVAYIGTVKDVLRILRRWGWLDTPGLVVQKRRTRNQRDYYTAGGRWITHLEFEGKGEYLDKAYEVGYSAEECSLVVTKYAPGDWEKQVGPRYMKAKMIAEAIGALDPLQPEQFRSKKNAALEKALRQS